MRALILAMLVPSLARAGGNDVTIGSTTRALPSSSAQAVTTDSLGGATFAYARELGAFVPRLALWIEGEVDVESTTGTLFQTMTTDVNDVALSSGARLRYTPVRHLALAVRLDLGAARTSLDLRDDAGHDASDARWSPFARAAAAVDLLAFDRPRFALGLRLEVGYVATHGVTLAPSPAGSGDALKLATMTSSLGRLDLSGPYVGVGLTSRF